MIGKSVSRKEDDRLVRGHGKYLDDIVRPNMLHLGVVRSPHASARIKSVSKTRAAAMPGVVAVLSAADTPEVRRPIPPYTLKPKFRRFDQPVLPSDRVRYVGEPVVVVVADDPRRLADALGEVEILYEPLPAVSSIESAIV